MSGSSGFRRQCAILVTVVVAALWSVVAAATPASADGGTLRGRVLTAGAPLAGYDVTLFASGVPAPLGTARSGPDGAFTIDYTAPAGTPVVYAVATNPGDRRVTLASVLGAGVLPGDVVINERTTVATGFALARFTDGGRIDGGAPGLPNAAGMARNLVDPVSGEVGAVLATSPNGPDTETLGTFGSLADMIANCVAVPVVCDQLLNLAGEPGRGAAADTWQAMVNTARHPWQNVPALFALSKAGPAPYQPDRVLPPSAWTLALRFVGDGHSIDGPGNIAVDDDGNIWVTNNYQYAPSAQTPVCGANNLIRLTPTGQNFPGSPYTGGGLSGAGFGIDIDDDGNVWVANFGFAAPVPDCPEQDQPPHNSVSLFSSDGVALSPDEGFTQGGISWPQGTIVHGSGDVWFANCGNDSVTVYPGGDPGSARQLIDLGIVKPFGLAEGTGGTVFVTGNGSNTVAVLGPDGTPIVPPVAGGGLDKPLGVATDSAGTAWVSNSRTIGLPCPTPEGPVDLDGTLTRIGARGELLTPTPLSGGGLRIPWGIAVDGNDNVWVANFGGQAVSQFCGVRVVACRPGTTTGAPISPDGTGYGFDGLTRNTAVAIDQAGNVWVTNNWKQIPIQTNPGGYEMVAFVGAAAPVIP